MQSLERLNVQERKQKGPIVAVSTVAFALSPLDAPAEKQGLWIPLVRRIREPFLNKWALPGSPTLWNQTLTETAQEMLFKATQTHPSYLEQLHAFGAVERSAETQRTVTIAYWAQFLQSDFADDHEVPENVQWFNINHLPDLAFDHAEIIELAVNRLRARTQSFSVAHRFLPDEFTIAQLRRAHEIILDTELDPANFRRSILATNTFKETGNVFAEANHRPAKLYKYVG